MSMSRTVALCTVLVFSCMGSAAQAGQYFKAVQDDQWYATHHAIYELENLIAFVEADPQTDDGYKAPIVTKARAEILRLQATLPRAEWRWRTPCCYSRKPIYIR